VNKAKTIYSSQDIYQILEDEIINLALQPGEYLSETETSKRFGVSRTPIRDVFKKLEYNNFVKIIPQKGTVIMPINLKKIYEFMFFREKIELGIIEEVMENKDDAKLVPLQLLLVQQRKLLEDNSIEFIAKSNEFFSLDNDFHQILFELSNKSNLWITLMSLMPDYQRFRAISADFNTMENLHSLYSQHNQILHNIRNNDLESNRTLYKDHVYFGLQYLSDLVLLKEEFFVI